MKFFSLRVFSFVGVLSFLFMYGCSGFFPQSGPTTLQVYSKAEEIKQDTSRLPLVVVNLSPQNVALLNKDIKQSISDFLTEKYIPSLGAGDVVEIVIQEQYPNVLFPPNYVVPAQVISEKGVIVVPYIGELFALGKTPEKVADEIKNALKGKANNPAVFVNQLSRESSYITVFGSVKESKKVQLSYTVSTILDALAQTGGVVSPLEKTMIQLVRNNKSILIPLEEIIRSAELNLNLLPKDTLTVHFKNQSATVLGAVTKNEEVEFECRGISLSQLLARVGGLSTNLADVKGIFVFRFEDKDIAKKLNISVDIQKEVPIIYNLDLSTPEGFFVAKNFTVRDKDIIYVATAPSVQYQHFLNLITNTLSPIFMIDRMSKN